MSQIDNTVEWYDRIQMRAADIAAGTLDAKANGDTCAWIQQEGVAQGMTYLLAHADDGVIWGRWENGKLLTSFDAASAKQRTTLCPPFRNETLQQARLFSEYGEILVWHDSYDGQWRWRKIIDGDGEAELNTFDEHQILWGTHAQPAGQSFSLMSDGSEGLHHIVPISVKTDGNGRHLRLWVRHYLAESDIGFIYVAHSRLIGLEVVEHE